jgi:hypothetical protein
MVLYNTLEVAKLLKVRPITVRQYILDKKLKASFIRKNLCYNRRKFRKIYRKKC